MQLTNQSPISRSRTLWVWTTLAFLLLAVTAITPGVGQVQAAESPQQQPRDVSLLNKIKALLEKLQMKLDQLLNHIDPPTTSHGISTTTDSEVTDNPNTSDGPEVTSSTTDSDVEPTSATTVKVMSSTTTEQAASPASTDDSATSTSTEDTAPSTSTVDSETSTSTNLPSSSTNDPASSTSTEDPLTSTSTVDSESSTSTVDSISTSTVDSTSSTTDDLASSTSTVDSASSTTTVDSAPSTSTDLQSSTSTNEPASSTSTEYPSTSTVDSESSTSTVDSISTSTVDSTSSTTEDTASSTSTEDPVSSTSTEDPDGLRYNLGLNNDPADNSNQQIMSKIAQTSSLHLAKRSLSMTRKLLEDEEEVCTTESESSDDSCVKLKEVIATIAEVTEKLENDEVTEAMLSDLEDASNKMDGVLEDADTIDINEEVLQSEITNVEDAIKVAQDSIDTQNQNSQTLVIVLGSVGGFIVVALVATLIFVYYKKRKISVDEKQKLNTEYVPINSFKEDGHDNPNFKPEVVAAQRPAQPQEVQTYGTPSSNLQAKRSQAKDSSSNLGQNYYETPAYSKADGTDSHTAVPQRTSYRGGYGTADTQGQQPTYSRSPADKVPRPNFYGNTNKQPLRPVVPANYDTDHRSPSRPTSRNAYDYERTPNRSGYESDVRVPRVAPKPISPRPYSPPARSYDEEANDPYSLDARGNVKRLSGVPAAGGGLRRIDN